MIEGRRGRGTKKRIINDTEKRTKLGDRETNIYSWIETGRRGYVQGRIPVCSLPLCVSVPFRSVLEYPSLSLSVFFASLSVSLSLCLFISLSLCLSPFLFQAVSVSPCVSLAVCLSVCLLVSLCLSLPVSLSASLSPATSPTCKMTPLPFRAPLCTIRGLQNSILQPSRHPKKLPGTRGGSRNPLTTLTDTGGSPINYAWKFFLQRLQLQKVLLLSLACSPVLSANRNHDHYANGGRTI